MRVLITGGGTVEKIDNMRTISNESSGRTAYELARHFEKDHHVTLLLSRKSVYKLEGSEMLTFLSVEDLYHEIKKLCSHNFDLIIHAAAVGDYTVESIESRHSISRDKVPSGIDDLTLKLKPTRKIINEFKRLFPRSKLVGFKLTSNMNSEDVVTAVKKVMTDSQADMIVHNDLSRRQRGDDHFKVFDPLLTSIEIKEISRLAAYLSSAFENKSTGVYYDTLS